MDNWKPMGLAAAILGISRVTLGSWVRRGLVRAKWKEIGGTNLRNRLVSMSDAHKLMPSVGKLKAGRPCLRK